MKANNGFTLIELIISLVLGLLVGAAALQVFITANQGVRFQQGAANIQNSGIFGLDYIIKDIRRANIDSNEAAITSITKHGGIVFNVNNLTSSGSSVVNKEDLEKLLTDSSVGPSNLKDQKSDQLVIQYKNTIGSQYTCEGERVLPNQFVVQRYFIKEETSSGIKSYSLRCKAMTYMGDSETSFNLAGDGEMLIPNVEHFRIIFEVAKDTLPVGNLDGVMDQFTYVSASEYKKLQDKPQIVAVQLGILLRSPDSVSKGTEKNKFTVLDLKNKELVAHADNTKYIRQVISQTVALRNGFGVKNKSE
ncbi:MULTISPECIES: PilW family protein [Acinetobacter]|uniref:PilW family protein n=1 Tax=Acinetobacter TaxID=469 RepID=UPI0015D1858A|nr:MULTISPECIES: PilW family protein [Acinetobacter]QOW51958.1 prepilin-type N-terminal cleavage/methylation domain-containing protein [Acinetobacter indicus]